MERLSFKKPRQHFDTAPHPTHVTFDDGKTKRNLPWMHYAEALWDSAQPDVIKVEISEWIVMLTGYNLGALFAAIEEHTLLRVRAHPEFMANHDDDCLVAEIRFVRPVTMELPPLRSKKGKTPQMDLGID
jgi:hypothetical protein